MATIGVHGKITQLGALECLPSGIIIVNFHVAETPAHRPHKGRIRPGHTNFYKVSAVGELAKKVRRDFNVGDLVSIKGEEYGFTRPCRCCPKGSGHTRYMWEIWVESVVSELD
jgi:single-stranded DNA-binding protein